MNARPLACLGGAPAFARPLTVGQGYLPAWDRYEAAFTDIFERQYYTNQGPLTERFEAELARVLQVGHVVCVTNETIGLIMVAEALALRGPVLLPALAPAACVQALAWAGLSPLFCEVSPRTGQLDLDALPEQAVSQAGAVLGVNLWGGSCDPARLQTWADRHGLPLFLDSTQAFGCHAPDGRPLGGFGAAEVFSFHASQLLSTLEGGGIATNDAQLAEKLRNIRSSYGARRPVPVVKTSNGRMSEAQAALGLMALADLPQRLDRNARLHACYRDGLSDLTGLEVLAPAAVSQSNHQTLMLRVDEAVFGLSVASLQAALAAEQVMAERVQPAGGDTASPGTRALCGGLLQLPLGACLDQAGVARICELLRALQQQAGAVGVALEGCA
ncbi:MAG: DegT/DnrJ/EryC1/StrS family aminotransferase [Comamonadaceae bacterium]|nr:DegT/DnrJ/EryC1/StrS family aminotransferase [Comamonadaceae bacterium]